MGRGGPTGRNLVRPRLAPDVCKKPSRRSPAPARQAGDLAVLLSQAADGDRDAFRLLYQATASTLHGIALRIVRRRDLAEDVVQDAYVRVWRRAADFDPTRGSAIAWMAAIARNRALEVARRGEAPSRADLIDSFETPCDRPDPEAQAELSDQLRRLVRHLQRLGGDQSGAVVLAYREGWSREELALHFGRPASTIKTWLRRSLISLKQDLEQ